MCNLNINQIVLFSDNYLSLKTGKKLSAIHTSVSTASGGTFLTWMTLDGTLSNLAYKKHTEHEAAHTRNTPVYRVLKNILHEKLCVLFKSLC